MFEINENKDYREWVYISNGMNYYLTYMESFIFVNLFNGRIVCCNMIRWHAKDRDRQWPCNVTQGCEIYLYVKKPKFTSVTL